MMTPEQFEQANSSKRQIAQSGRVYYSIPDGYDVEEWDEMNPYERLKAKGLIEEDYPSIDDPLHDSMIGLGGEETWDV